MKEIQKIRNKARTLSLQLYGNLLARIEYYGVYTSEAVFNSLSAYDIVLPFELIDTEVERAYSIANQILDGIEYEGFSSCLMKDNNTHYLCIKFWREY